MKYRTGWRLILIVLLVLMMAFGSSLTGLANDSEWVYEEDWDGRGKDSLRCDLIGEGPRTEAGWIHWVFSTKGESDNAKLVLSGTGEGEYAPGPPLNAETWHFYTPYYELEGLEATIYLDGEPGPGGGLVISDYCPGKLVEELTVTKTAVTSYEREHFWDIDKNVETENKYTIDGIPKIWLYIDGSGNETATWTVDVTYEGYEDSNFNVSGDVTIENTGNTDAEILSVIDSIFYIPEDLSTENEVVVDLENGVEFPYTLAVGGILEFSYSFDFDQKTSEAVNNVRVTTEREVYTDSAVIEWGEPTKEINETVNIKDVSDLFGEKHLGSVTAPNGDQFTYDKDFEYFDGAESAVYDNTATIVETGRSADAQLKVNVQEFVFDGETAWAANGNKSGQLRYTPRGNWATYVQYAEKTTTLFAGQHIPVGTVTFSAVEDGEVTITVELFDEWVFEDVSEFLKVQDYAMAPSGNPAPGQFEHKIMDAPGEGVREASITVPANNFYGVHVEVGQWVPDPDFGPY